jgi:hypothetical protein
MEDKFKFIGGETIKLNMTKEEFNNKVKTVVITKCHLSINADDILSKVIYDEFLSFIILNFSKYLMEAHDIESYKIEGNTLITEKGYHFAYYKDYEDKIGKIIS